MSYTNQSSLEKAITERSLIQLTDDESTGEVDTVILAEVLENTDSLIDSYMPNPIDQDNIPKVIGLIALDIAKYKLYERRIDGEMPETVLLGFKNAIKLLEQFMSGKMKIGDTTIDNSFKIKTTKTSEDRIFNDNMLGQF